MDKWAPSAAKEESRDLETPEGWVVEGVSRHVEFFHCPVDAELGLLRNAACCLSIEELKHAVGTIHHFGP
jgi:hypothetical protein